MTDSCTAAVLSSYKQPLELRQFPIPSPGAGEALVRVEMAGICGTDVHLADGELDIPLPVILGHETVGKIEKLGPQLDRDWRGVPLAVGDRVAWASSVVCGECYYCRQKHQPTRCISRKAYGISYCANDQPHLRGGYAEYILLRSGTAIFRIPDAIPTAAVVGAGCALTTALHGLERATVTLGDVVVVQGSGPVGLAVLAVALQSGASQVIVIGAPRRRLDLALEFSAHAVISVEEATTSEARRKRLFDQIGPYGADVVVECVGRPSVVPEGWEFCRDGGKYLVLGQYANAGEVLMNPHTITRKQLQVIGSWGFEPRHLDKALGLLEHRHWQTRFASEVTDRYPLSQANEALEKARLGNGGKTVITP
ncbi:MAG TPA: zinc-binding dehydrogenase [Candidatus Acidoferrales bacterium]|nr:zinc-binding dehydrogenase [Candidatus Acidoferrales bacterium]